MQEVFQTDNNKYEVFFNITSRKLIETIEKGRYIWKIVEHVLR